MAAPYVQAISDAASRSVDSKAAETVLAALASPMGVCSRHLQRTFAADISSNILLAKMLWQMVVLQV
jgi:hypothetical protein